MKSFNISTLINYFFGLVVGSIFIYGIITAILAAILGGTNEHISLR